MSSDSSSDHARLNEELTQARETIAQLEKEYAEFEKESRELEEHLESEVSRLEDELEAANKKLKIAKSELQDSKEKQIDTERGMQTTIQSLEQELEQERAKSAKLASRLVSMEQENEDLERVHRELEADFGKSQSTMDNALEENAVIQTDLEELRNLSRETIQRLTDELRELMEENARLQRYSENGMSNSSPRVPSSPHVDAQNSEQRSSLISTPRKASEAGTPRSAIPGSPMERRRDLLETLNTIAGLAKALESKLTPQS